MGASMAMEVFMENPKITWMKIGGTPHFRKPHIYIYINGDLFRGNIIGMYYSWDIFSPGCWEQLWTSMGFQMSF